MKLASLTIVYRSDPLFAVLLDIGPHLPPQGWILPVYRPGLSCQEGGLLSIVGLNFDQGQFSDGESLPFVDVARGSLYLP